MHFTLLLYFILFSRKLQFIFCFWGQMSYNSAPRQRGLNCNAHDTLYRSEPIQYSQHPAGKHPVQYDRPGNGEYFAPDSENLTLLFVFDGRGGHGVGESRDGHERAGTAPLGDGGVHVDAGQDDAYENQEHGSPAAAFVLGQVLELAEIVNALSDRANDPAN